MSSSSPDRRSVLHMGAALTAASLSAASLPVEAAVQPPVADATGIAPRDRILFSFDWRFALGHASDMDRDFGFGQYQKTYAKQGQVIAQPVPATYDDSAWTPVTLPHDWAVALPFAHNEAFIPPKNPEDGDPNAGHGYKAIGRDHPENSVGWYRKVFTLDKGDEDRCLSIEFDGVFRDCTVILNGYVLARHESGYTPFSIDIGNFIDPAGPNVLLVRVDASYGEGWFYEGAGIYRNVWLVKSDRTHIAQWGVWVNSTVEGRVAVETRLANASDEARTVSLRHSVIDREGQVVASATVPATLGPRSDMTLACGLDLASPRLWSLEDPYLYALRSEVLAGDVRIDAAVTTFGVRAFRFDAATGFYLNGRPVKLKGANNHQDHAGIGTAITGNLHAWRVRQMKAMGANIWRCSHNPPSPELLDACDRLGMLVIDETRPMTSTPEGLSQLRTLIVRDRNHPSVILWSIGNEETAQQGTERGLKIAMDMRRAILELDPTRPITAAMNHYQGYGITPALDVMGFNYHEADIESFRKLYPDMPIIGTETASAVETRGEYVRDDVKGYVRAYDLDAPSYAKTAEAWWTLYNSKPYLSGGLVWTGFDYRGEPTPFNRWPEISSHFGILDTCGFPKDIYHYYSSWWQPDPVLHLLPHWNWEGQDGKDIAVWAYSNCEEVELFVNGRSAGRKAMERDRHLEWNVPYAAGRIEAYGYNRGKVVMKDMRRTAGSPARLVLSCDSGALASNGQDVALIRVEAVDAAGAPCPTADSLVSFAIQGEGSVLGVGNGNPTSLEADCAAQRRLFNGLAQAVVRAKRDAAGMLKLEASTQGLPPAMLNLRLIA